MQTHTSTLPCTLRPAPCARAAVCTVLANGATAVVLQANRIVALGADVIAVVAVFDQDFAVTSRGRATPLLW